MRNLDALVTGTEQKITLTTGSKQGLEIRANKKKNGGIWCKG